MYDVKLYWVLYFVSINAVCIGMLSHEWNCDIIVLLCMPPPVGKGTISVAFVRLSIRPPVAYIANNSRTQRPSTPKFERKLPHLWYDSHTSFKVKRSKLPGPLMLTFIVRHIFRTPRPTKFKLGIRMEDDDPHQPQAPWPPKSKVKVSRSRDIGLSRLSPMLYVSLEAGGAYRVGRTRRPHCWF